MLLRLLAIVLLHLLLVLLPAQARKFDAQSFKVPHRPKLEGALAKNTALQSSLIIGKGTLRRPEDIAIDNDGNIYTGSAKSGTIYKIRIGDDGTQSVQPFAEPGGGTLGLLFDKDQNLIACNSALGLISVDQTGKITALTNHSEFETFKMPDDLDIDKEGKIYFTNATNKYYKLKGMHSYVFDLIQGGGNGSLNVYDPATKQTQRLLPNLHFANGVALGPDEDYLLICETSRFRVLKYWLKGPKAGSTEIFTENLIGLPDGVTRDPNGGFWVAIPALRTKYIDAFENSTVLRDFLGQFPGSCWRSTKHYGLIIHFNDEGKATASLQDPQGRVYFLTNIVPWRNYFYLGTLDGNSIARYERTK